MKKVECEIEEVELEGENQAGRLRTIMGVRATCPNCDHQTESYGTGERSVKRCLALLREECPNNEENFYTTDDS